jgi:hypothetical protein
MADRNVWTGGLQITSLLTDYFITGTQGIMGVCHSK